MSTMQHTMPGDGAPRHRPEYDWLDEPLPRQARLLGPPEDAVAAERVERAAWTDLLVAAPPALARRLGLSVERHGNSVLCLRAAHLDSLLFNRTFGLPPYAGPVPLDDVLTGYARRGIERFWIHLGSGARRSELGQALGAAGLASYPRSWIKVARGPGPIEPATTALQVRPLRPADAPAFGRLIASAFDIPPHGAALLSALVGRPRWHLFGAFDGERLAAAGALFVDGEIGCLPMAATRPEHRRRGAQGALMRARIETALGLGCRVITTETGEPSVGGDDPSFRNMLRHGLRPVALRENWGPAGLCWATS